MPYGRHRHGSRGTHGSARWPLLGLGLGGGAVAAAVVATAVGLTQVAGGQACASALSPASGVISGTATHYVLQSGTGNCMFPPPADGLYVALSPSEYDNAAPCGSYLNVTGPDGSVRVEVFDQCPPCAAGHIDLSETAFAKIAPLAAGLVSVSYQSIADPPLPGPVGLRVKEGSSQYWLALLVMNAGNPVASVAVRGPSGGWQDLARASFNYWIAASGAGPGPLRVRVTDTLGHQVTAHGIAIEPGVVEATGVWMYSGGSTPPPPPPPTSTPSPPAPSARTSAPAPATASATPARPRRSRRPASPSAARLAARPGRSPAAPATQGSPAAGARAPVPAKTC
jgi:expansin (peptidoglycan-binding protein)